MSMVMNNISMFQPLWKAFEYQKRQEIISVSQTVQFER